MICWCRVVRGCRIEAALGDGSFEISSISSCRRAGGYSFRHSCARVEGFAHGARLHHDEAEDGQPGPRLQKRTIGWCGRDVCGEMSAPQETTESAGRCP